MAGRLESPARSSPGRYTRTVLSWREGTSSGSVSRPRSRCASARTCRRAPRLTAGPTSRQPSPRLAAIELVDDRYEDFATIGAATLIADNAFDAGSILGAPAPGWRQLNLGAL